MYNLHDSRYYQLYNCFGIKKYGSLGKLMLNHVS